MEFFSGLEQLIQDNQAWAAPIIGLIALGESLVFVGLFIPATAVMLLIGGLLGSGVIPVVPVLVAAIIGCILGDIVSYAIGRSLGPRLVYKPALLRYRHAFARTRLFFRKYGFASIFLGRFLGPIRSTIPLVAGMMAMDQKRFQLANVASAIVWAPLMFAPGWLAAKGFSRYGDMVDVHMSTFAWVMIAILALTAVGTVAISRHIGRRQPRRRRIRTLPVRS